MPKVKNLKKYVVISRVLVLLIVIAAIFILFTMRTPGHQPGKLSGQFIHEPQVSIFDSDAFEARREIVSRLLEADIIILSADAGPDFRYLTGFPERRGVAVIIPGDETAYRLFVTPWEIYTVMWSGQVYGIEGAQKQFDADAAYPLDQFDDMLPQLLSGKRTISLHQNDRRVKEMVSRVLQDSGMKAEIQEMAPVLHELRVFKDQWEAEQIKQAVAVTVKAHQYVLQTIKPGQAEYDVQAEIEYIFRRNGMTPGFSPIVGTGPNTCLLHHRPGDRILREGDLLLIDIGANSLGGYKADVTRTLPVNGRFNPKQRKIYELVLKASDEALQIMKPGHHMLDPHHLAVGIMVNGLHEMGLIPDTTSWWQKRFYIQHRINHFIGLQGHDIGDYGYDISDRNHYILNRELRGREMKPGMVMSNEPGLYFMEGLLDGIHEMFGHLASEEELNAFVEEVRPVYERYEGIGVRIEDTILITEHGNENLSRKAPRTIREIEAAMRN